jgi:hypothetical protein
MLFGSLCRKSATKLSMRVPVHSLEHDWSLNNLKICKDLILEYINLVKDKQVSETYLRFIDIDVCYINKPTVTLDMLNADADEIDVYEIIDSDFIQEALTKAKVAIHINVINY